MKAEQIKHMANRFLGWRLPEAFKPDAGISYTPPHGAWSRAPTGTNLFDATQAEAMVRYMTEGMVIGFIVANGNRDKFRRWQAEGPAWTDDKSKAVLFVRREDAEAVFAEDEDAWAILPVTAADLA